MWKVLKERPESRIDLRTRNGDGRASCLNVSFDKVSLVHVVCIKAVTH